MLTDERLTQIAGRLARLHKRVDCDDVGWLVHACEDLLEEVRRLTPVQGLLWEVMR